MRLDHWLPPCGLHYIRGVAVRKGWRYLSINTLKINKSYLYHLAKWSKEIIDLKVKDEMIKATVEMINSFKADTKWLHMFLKARRQGTIIKILRYVYNAEMFPSLDVSDSQSLLIVGIKRYGGWGYQTNSSGCPEPKTMNSNASKRADKSSVLILCHIYQLITYLLFQFFPSLQPSCRRTLHLWIR